MPAAKEVYLCSSVTSMSRWSCVEMELSYAICQSVALAMHACKSWRKTSQADSIQGVNVTELAWAKTRLIDSHRSFFVIPDSHSRKMVYP